MKRICWVLCLFCFCTPMVAHSEGDGIKKYNTFIGGNAGFGMGGFTQKTYNFQSGLSAGLRGGTFFSDHFGVGGIFQYNHMNIRSAVNLDTGGDADNFVIGAQALARVWGGFTLGPYAGLNHYSGQTQKFYGNPVAGTGTFNAFGFGWTFGYEWLLGSSSWSLQAEGMLHLVMTHEPLFLYGNMALGLRKWF